MQKVILVFMIVLLGYAQPIGAAQKITVDPNASGACMETLAAPDVDERLEQNVTYSAKSKSVLVILTDLSKMTGVKLVAGYNNQDWQTRDRKMNIFVKDIPLSSLMDSIAHVMKFMWHRSDVGGVWIYRLYMDRNTLLGVERQRLREEERLAKLESQQREQWIKELAKVAVMSDVDPEKIKEDNPALYVHAKVGWAALMPALFSQVPEAGKAWSAGETMILNTSDLPQEAQQAVLKTIDVMNKFSGKTTGTSIPASATQDLSRLRICINIAKKEYGYRGDTYIGDMTIAWPGGSNNTAFAVPDSEAAKKSARDYIRILDGQPVTQEQQFQMNQGHLAAVQEQKTDFGEPLIEHEDDPALNVKVKLKIEGR